MSDLHHPCEPWVESISLAAAGCLSPDEERDLRRHIETCSDCRERFRQLAQLCGTLTESRLPDDSPETIIVERVMSAIASDGSRRPLVRREVEKDHATLLTRSLDTWRWIMRSPVSRVSAAAIFVLAITGVALWFHAGGTTPAFADFIAPILEAKTAKFKVTTVIKGPPAVTTAGEVMVLGATRSRQEIETEMAMPDKSKARESAKSKMVMIFDWGQGKSITLVPETKQAMVVSLANMTKEQAAQQDPFTWFRSVLLDAKDKPDVKREPLGEKEIDGRRVVGFRVSTKGMVVNLWGDPKTGMPVLAEATMALFPNAKMTMSDFVFDVKLDESSFSIDPPAGYTVQKMNVDASLPEEKDLIAMFRQYSKLLDGQFPDSLDFQTMMQTVGKMIGMKAGIQALREKLDSGKEKLSEEERRKFEELMRKMTEWQFAPGKATPSEEGMRKLEEEMRRHGDWEKIMQKLTGKGKPNKAELPKTTPAEMQKMMEPATKKLMEVQIPLQRGLMFATMLPPEADAHYAGKGVKMGAVDTPIFWYRPKDAKKYRVVYADLAVQEADIPPSAPNAQSVPTASAPKK